MHILMYGDPFDGLKAIAPFKTPEAAAEYAAADRNVRNDTWWTIEAEKPDPTILEEDHVLLQWNDEQ